MESPAQDPQDESIGDLFHRLIDDGRDYARAEFRLVKELAQRRMGLARSGFIALLAGGALVLGAAIGLVVGLVLGLATLVGPVLAGLIAAAAFALVGWLSIRFGLQRLKALAGDEDEKSALERGEDE
ncbi:MAG: phage holin family protein [Sphingosinicella sp.]